MYYLIDKTDVFEIDYERFEDDHIRDTEVYRVTIKQDAAVVSKVLVRISLELLIVTPMSDADKRNYVMKKAAQLPKVPDESREIVIVTANFESLKGKIVGDDEVDQELAVLIGRFFRKYPEPHSHILSPTSLFVSTDFDLWKIAKRLAYFKARGVLQEAFGNDKIAHAYVLAPEGFEKLEALTPRERMTGHTENKYFQVVPLPKGVKEPFVFVVMPFGEDEIDQKVYREVIKPTVEKELNIPCVRSDEVKDPGVINNQIFTLIKKAKLIIAETTTRNPNVFYEVGMAHAFNKDVFVFNRSGKDLPFDIASNRAVFYDDDEDLKRKLVENLRDHV